MSKLEELSKNPYMMRYRSFFKEVRLLEVYIQYCV